MSLSPADLLALDRKHIWHPYTQTGLADEPLSIVRGEGVRLIDSNGQSYLDMISSWWVNLHGHGHPAIAEAIAAQARTLEQVIFADCTHEPATLLASRLAALLPDTLDRFFFSDDGSTAIEVALKIALQFWDNVGQRKRTRLIAFEGGYHGDTVGAMSTGATSGYFRAWKNLLFPVDFLPYPDIRAESSDIEEREAASLEALDRLLREYPGEVAAVITEPLIQGAAGMRISRPEFLSAVSARLKEDGALLILDEVMTGFGRTGSLFAFQQANITPAMICLSKGLTGGFLPMALTVVNQEIYEKFTSKEVSRAFLHGHSFTANPLGCAAALASLDLLLDPACEARRRMIADVHATHLRQLGTRFDIINPRQIGTIAAFTLALPESITPLRRFLLKNGILMRPLPGGVFYILPPYCVTKEELDGVYDVLINGLDRHGMAQHTTLPTLEETRQSRYGDGSVLF